MQLNASPPAIIFKTNDPKWSYARGPFVFMSRKHGAVTLRHELFHVRQFWALLGLGVVLAFALALLVLNFNWLAFLVPFMIAAPVALFELNDQLDFQKEAAAYAESVRNGGSLDVAARNLSEDNKFYTYDKSYEECRREIERRIPRQWWGGYALF